MIDGLFERLAKELRRARSFDWDFVRLGDALPDLANRPELREKLAARLRSYGLDAFSTDGDVIVVIDGTLHRVVADRLRPRP